MKLYKTYEDGDGHTYLIPKDGYLQFESALSDIEESYDQHNDYDIFNDELNMLLECYDRLEGEEYFVFLGGGVDWVV